jgi:hypothetical protein
MCLKAPEEGVATETSKPNAYFAAIWLKVLWPSRRRTAFETDDLPHIFLAGK